MSNPGKKVTADDEVEQLLRAAHDDVLLKLNVNSHMARASAAAAIDPDLDRRFQALKKPQKSTKLDDSLKLVAPKTDPDQVAAAAEDDDLFARFSALKNSLPSHSRNENSSGFPGDVGSNHEVRDDEGREDEVEKVIQWAIDAARLDPSPPSDHDDDDDTEDDDDDDDTDDDDDDDRKRGRRKVNKK